jgi:hypothetical protein
MKSLFAYLPVVVAVSLLGVGCSKGPHTAAPVGNWIPLFNGKDIQGWVPKIAGHPSGDNFANTFRVDSGTLKVAYDKYGDFKNQFGGLYFSKPFGHYWIRVEYRFSGILTPGAPDWAIRDSGLFMHAQSPQSMGLDQDFPASVELNMLGAGWRSRPTGDVCTNGGVVVTVQGMVMKDKCGHTSDVSVRGSRWVTAEAEVNGAGTIRHFVDGQLVAEYGQPKLDPTDPNAAALLDAGSPQSVSVGYIGIESNGFPVEFRRIEILDLDAVNHARQ